MKQELIKKIVIWVILFVIVWVISVFSYKQYQVYKAENMVFNINKILEKPVSNRDNCKIILDFDEKGNLKVTKKS